MKNPALSLWLSSVNQVAGFWMGHGANEIRRQQRMMLAEMTKVAVGGPAAKPKRPKKRRPPAKRRTP